MGQWTSIDFRLLRLIVLFIIAILLTFWIENDPSTAETLFQSAQSPVDQPEDEQVPAEESPSPEESPPEQTPVEETAPEQVPAGQTITETVPISVEDPGGEFLPAPETPSEPARLEPDGGDTISTDEESPEESHNFVLDRIEMIDTVVVSGAYVWLCCGVGLFLLVPVMLVLLYIRGRSKIIKEGDL